MEPLKAFLELFLNFLNLIHVLRHNLSITTIRKKALRIMMLSIKITTNFLAYEVNAFIDCM
jgi:hypothetical protein